MINVGNSVQMRLIIPHSDPKQDAKAAVDRSIAQVFTGFNLGAIQFVNQWKEWSVDTMAFSLIAKLGFLQTPIRGSALVTDSEVILDVDLGARSDGCGIQGDGGRSLRTFA